MTPLRHTLLAAAVALLIWGPSGARADAPPLLHAGTALADAKGVQLRGPEGVACTEDGRLVVSDSVNRRLLLFQYKDRAFTPGAEIKFEQLGRPGRVQIDSKGQVLALDQKSHRIVRVGQEGGFAGFVELKNVPPHPAPSFAVSFKLDRADNIYILDVGTKRVIVTDPSGSFTRQLPLPKGGFITDVAVDRAGTVFVVDGVQAIIYASQRSGTGFVPKPGSLKEFMNFPAYIAPAASGRLVLVDKNGSGLVVVGPDGKFLGRQLSQGWNEGLVYYPAQICLTESGLTFVADRNNNRVQAFVTLSR
jgi:hypothetical protein